MNLSLLRRIERAVRLSAMRFFARRENMKTSGGLVAARSVSPGLLACMMWPCHILGALLFASGFVFVKNIYQCFVEISDLGASVSWNLGAVGVSVNHACLPA
jgi:hypothetical protein